MEGQEPNESLHDSENNELSESSNNSGKRKRGEATVKNVDESLTLSIFSIQIGSWKREILHYKGEMQLKCYFKKKKFLWEMKDGDTLKKVEYNWSDLHSISFQKDEPNKGVFLLMLNSPPIAKFFQENRPKPKQHTKWGPSLDFTNNNASSFRNHMLKFEEKDFSKLQDRIIKVSNIYVELYNLLWPPRSILNHQVHIENQLTLTPHHPVLSAPHHQVPSAGQELLPQPHLVLPYPVQLSLPAHQMPGAGQELFPLPHLILPYLVQPSSPPHHQVSSTSHQQFKSPHHQASSGRSHDVWINIEDRKQYLSVPPHQEPSASHGLESSKSPPQQMTTSPATGNENSATTTTITTAPSSFDRSGNNHFNDLPDDFFDGLEDLNLQNFQPSLAPLEELLPDYVFGP